MLKEYFSIAEILELKLDGYLDRRNLEIKANQESWLFRTANSATKPYKEYHISNFPSAVREKIVNRLLERAKKEARNNGKSIEFVQESLRIAYSRLEIILFIKNTKLKVDVFCKDYNNRDIEEKRTDITGKNKKEDKYNGNFTYRAKQYLSQDCYENVPSISKTRVYEWIKQYDKFGIEGIKWKADERRLGKSKFGEIEDINIKQLVIGALLNRPHLKVKLIYKFLLELGKKKNIRIPSYRWVCRVIEDYKKNNKQEFLLASNPDKWKSKYLLAIGSYSDGITEPNQLWELDSSPADIMLEGGRYMILACIDVYSRRVKFLVNKTSNSLGITSLLRACMLEWGIPKAIKTDNGRDYVSQQISIVLNEFGIEHKLANPFQGQEKPHVERVFRRFQHDFVEALPNYVGHNVAERKALQSIKSFEDRLFGKEEVLLMKANSFQGFCDWWIETQYMNVPHHGIDNKTPNSRLENFIPKLPQGEQRYKLNLLLEPLAGKRTIVKKGIRVENTNYFNPVLAMYVGEQVMVRVDRFDMGKIYVFDEQNALICEAINYELLGADKQEFIQQGKAIQKAVIKEVKTKTKRLINKAKGKLDFLEPVQIDIEQAILEANVTNNVIADQQEETQVIEQEVDDKTKRYRYAKELEVKLSKGEEIEDLAWLLNYQKSGEYAGKSLGEKVKRNLGNLTKVNNGN